MTLPEPHGAEGAGDSPRPQPQYGEYATPEEVAALRGVPLESQAAVAPTAVPVRPPTATATAPSLSGGRRIDRMLTIAFIVFGVIIVIQSTPTFLDFAPALELAANSVDYGPIDLGSIDFGEAARIGGNVLLVISIVLVVAAAGFSYLALSRARLAFWIPLVAGALGLVCYLVVLGVVLYSTPGFIPPVT